MTTKWKFAIGAGILIWIGWAIAKRRKFTVTIPEDEIKIRFNVKGKPPGSPVTGKK